MGGLVRRSLQVRNLAPFEVLCLVLLHFVGTTLVVDQTHFLVTGMLLCDLDLLARNDDLPHFLKRLEPYKKPIYYTFFVVSILLGGIPSHTCTYTWGITTCLVKLGSWDTTFLPKEVHNFQTNKSSQKVC
jgi:hypothetical protein